MEMRQIGSLHVSAAGLGCNNFGWRLDETESRRVIDAAIDRGINFFDTADVYGGTQSETFIGRILTGRRDKIVLATKFGMEIDPDHRGAKPAYVKQAVEASLKRLATDRIDLYQLHRPDDATPIGDTLEGLGELVREGKVREIGCSNFSAEQLDEAEKAVKAGNARFVSVQNQLSLIKREALTDVVPACERLGLAFLPYFPLASGLLSGKYRKGQPLPDGARITSTDRYASLLTEENFDLVERLIAFAQRQGHTILDLAFAWLLAQPAVASVIAGATSPDQVFANARAGEWKLSAEDVKAIDDAVG